jgi:hypothetical protein
MASLAALTCRSGRSDFLRNRFGLVARRAHGATFTRKQQVSDSTWGMARQSINLVVTKGSRITGLRRIPSPQRAGTRSLDKMGAAMGRLIVQQGVVLLALFTPAIAGELTPTIQAALLPLSASVSVYSSAVTSLQKPEAPARDGRNDFSSRFEGQVPVRVLTPAQKEAIRAALNDTRLPAAVAATSPREPEEVRRRAQQEQEQWLKRQERVGLRAIASICDGCMGGARGLSRRIVPREYVGEDGLPYREQDLRYP